MQTFFKHDMVPSAVARRQRRKAAQDALDAAYAEVDLRDGGWCWVTGRYTQSGAPDARVRREHHHLKPRSTAPEAKADAHNIITVTSEAHSLITAGWIVVEGTDARKAIRFHWRADIKASQKPFVIKSRRS